MPPQQIYLIVHLRASAIPAGSPTRVQDSLPGGDSLGDERELSPPAPWSRVFAAGSFGFGGPTGSIEDVFHGLLVGSDSEDGLSAEELDGTYSYTASVEVGPHTLTSTAKVSVACA